MKNLEKEEVAQLLQVIQIVAIIDNIFKHYDVISAKRMHRWGD